MLFYEEMGQTSSVGQGKFSLPPWLPVAASLVLMVMVAFVAALNARSLKNVTQWRRHSTQVILAGQVFENNLRDMQREIRNYLTLGIRMRWSRLITTRCSPPVNLPISSSSR